MTNISMIPKDVFERGIIRMTEGGIITMPDKDVWARLGCSPITPTGT